MQKKIVWEWEHLDESTQRVKVIGGWLVMRLGVTDVEKGKPGKVVFRETMVFLADRDHEWQNIPPIVETPVEKAQNKAADFAPK